MPSSLFFPCSCSCSCSCSCCCFCCSCCSSWVLPVCLEAGSRYSTFRWISFPAIRPSGDRKWMFSFSQTSFWWLSSRAIYFSDILVRVAIWATSCAAISRHELEHCSVCTRVESWRHDQWALLLHHPLRPPSTAPPHSSSALAHLLTSRLSSLASTIWLHSCPPHFCLHRYKLFLSTGPGIIHWGLLARQVFVINVSQCLVCFTFLHIFNGWSKCAIIPSQLWHFCFSFLFELEPEKDSRSKFSSETSLKHFRQEAYK